MPARETWQQVEASGVPDGAFARGMPRSLARRVALRRAFRQPLGMPRMMNLVFAIACFAIVGYVVGMAWAISGA